MTLIVVAALLAGALAPAAWIEPVCLRAGNAPPFDVSRARETATRMFAEIGVQIDWHPDVRYCKARAEDNIIVSLTTGVPATRFPGALAYALPYEGAHVEVFFDRVVKTAAEPARVPSLLAHVLVHEVSHLLQGVSRHSQEGVMKQQWNQRDYVQMAWKPLPFTAEDVKLIRLGMNARTSRLAMRK